MVMSYLGSGEMPETIEGAVQELRKYGTLQKFVPLVVCMKNGCFKDDVAKQEVIVETLCLSGTSIDIFSLKYLLKQCPNSLSSIIKYSAKVPKNKIIVDLQLEITQYLNSASNGDYWSAISNMLTFSQSKKALKLIEFWILQQL